MQESEVDRMDAVQQILEAIEELHKEHPSWRFGQLVANVSLFAKGPVGSAVWDVEDEDFLTAAQAHLAYLQAKRREQIPA